MNYEMSHISGVQKISYRRFAAVYNWLLRQPLVRCGFDPVRRELISQAQGIVLEVGAGGGQNFPFYDPTRVERVKAVEPDEAMLVEARRRLAALLAAAPVGTAWPAALSELRSGRRQIARPGRSRRA